MVGWQDGSSGTQRMMGDMPKSSAIQRCSGWILIPVFGLNWQLHWNVPGQPVTWRGMSLTKIVGREEDLLGMNWLSVSVLSLTDEPVLLLDRCQGNVQVQL